METVSRYFPSYLLRPVDIIRSYDQDALKNDIAAAITVAVILLPQAIAFALIAELPPQIGIYAAIVGGIVGGLWGSSNQIHTGPVNASSLLVASILLAIASPESPEYIIAAGMLALMSGLFQTVLGAARLGVLVNFISHSVIVGFAAGAGIQIAIKQIRPLLGISYPGGNLVQTFYRAFLYLPETHIATAALGVGTIILIVGLRQINRKIPGPLIAMIGTGAIVFALGLNEAGVEVIGVLTANLPPIAPLPIFDLDLIAELSVGALAVGAIGLVQAAAIGRSLAVRTGQRLDNDQEFVGQGLANVAVGIFSGYPVAASFTRSAVNADAGARTPMAGVFSALIVLVALFTAASYAAFLPMSAVAGVLIITAFGLIDHREIVRIWRGAREDAIIMIVTLVGTLFLRLDFAVLAGILLSFAIYIKNTSSPSVQPVVPDANFKHFIYSPEKPECPQLGIVDIRGDLYFGAVSHIEEAIQHHMSEYPRQRFLLLRMHNVNQCDFSGIHMLESIVKLYRDKGGDVYVVRVREPIVNLMKATGFYRHLGKDHFLAEDTALEYLFYHVLDPAICIYESNVRVFRECQKLARPDYAVEIPLIEFAKKPVEEVEPRQLWDQLKTEEPPLVIDVREPREYHSGHIPDAQLLPLPKLLANAKDLPPDQSIIFVCQSGRRSIRAAQFLKDKGYQKVSILHGGMVEWGAEGLLKAVDR